jgi:hypothetical protein
MAAYRFLAILAPLLAGLAAAWALAATEGRPPLKRALRVGIVLLLCLPFGKAGLIAVALALLVSTAYLAARGLRVPPGPSQVAASAIPVLLYSILFLMGTYLGELGDRGITLGLELNPISVISISVLGDDFYHRPTFYRMDFAAYKHAPPVWTGTVLMYLSAAGVLGVLAFALRRKSA